MSPASLSFVMRVILESKKNLEERRVARIPLRMQFLYQLFKRQVLMA